MTLIQERAIELIKKMPDEKICYVVNILESIDGLLGEKQMRAPTATQAAYQNIQRYRKCGNKDRNYKAELAEALEEKYADIN